MSPYSSAITRAAALQLFRLSDNTSRGIASVEAMPLKPHAASKASSSIRA